MNLDNDDEEEEANQAMQDRERTAMEQLEKALSRCQRCGDSKACKIDNGGNHVHLTFQQRRSWSIAIVCDASLNIGLWACTNILQAAGTHGVTLKTPPKGEHFMAFHGSSSRQTSGIDPGPHINSQAMMPFAGYGWLPGYSMMAPSMPLHTTPARPSTPEPVPSSDPPDVTSNNPYPLISDFITQLQLQHPLRMLTDSIFTFTSNDYFYIDEVIALTKEELMGPEFKLSGGNAKFILGQVDDETRRIEHVTGRRRRRARA
jgi:hypothetical protein